MYQRSNIFHCWTLIHQNNPLESHDRHDFPPSFSNITPNLLLTFGVSSVEQLHCLPLPRISAAGCAGHHLCELPRTDHPIPAGHTRDVAAGALFCLWRCLQTLSPSTTSWERDIFTVIVSKPLPLSAKKHFQSNLEEKIKWKSLLSSK